MFALLYIREVGVYRYVCLSVFALVCVSVWCSVCVVVCVCVFFFLFFCVNGCVLFVSAYPRKYRPLPRNRRTFCTSSLSSNRRFPFLFARLASEVFDRYQSTKSDSSVGEGYWGCLAIEVNIGERRHTCQWNLEHSNRFLFLCQICCLMVGW